MCGRYKLSEKSGAVYEFFDIHGEQIKLELTPHYNIAPTQPIASVRTPHQLEFVRWGIKLANPRAGGFNVRVESLGAPFYRDSIRGRRCLILADGFYEWRVEGEGKAAKKQPFLIKRHDGKPFAFAGMWDKVSVKGEFVDAATILTTTPRGVAAEVHDRMPVILSPENHAKWLDPSARYLDLLEPDAAALELVPVSTTVNSVKNDGPECAERATN
ncbi:MAG TPA: SOS response-associated peptidase [Polyangiaceae bacterium]|nr:SOS response-associated peptidase [Polyangiaceae bacterium]